MRKLALCLLVLPLLMFAQEISVYGNRGMFKLQYAQPHNMGMLSFHISPEERYEEMSTTQQGTPTTDRKHFFKVSTGLSYAIIDYIEARFRMTPFMKWFEMNNYPIKRGDPDPVIGFETFEIGGKVGYPFIVDKITPLQYAIGTEFHVDFGPGLSRELFSNAYNCDKRFYADSFTDGNATPVTPHFPPHIPHDPDYGINALFDFLVGPFAAHLNGGYLYTGIDKQPNYVADADFRQRPNYVIHGIGIELMPSPDVHILFETYGYFDSEAETESLWVTPGIRFGTRSVSFDLGVELGIIGEWFWKAFFNISGGGDLIKKLEIHIPIAKVSGRVTDAKTGEPVAATLTFPGSDKEPVQVSTNGTYEVSFSPGNYRVHAEAPNYRWKEQGAVLKDGDNVVLDFILNKKEVSTILGKIFDAETRTPIIAEVSFPKSQFNVVTSDTSGMYTATLAPGTFRVHVEATGYQFDEKVVTLQEGESRVLDFPLSKVMLVQATLVGKVSSADSGNPLLAQITFVDTKIPTTTSDPTTGIYKVTTSPGTYSLKVEAQGYITETTPVVLVKDETKIQNFSLRRIPVVGTKIVLRGVYFDFNSAVIKPESYPVLDDAAKVLLARPTMRVEISGHTDSIGSDAYNLQLSNLRANAVRNYLITYHKIDYSRLIGIGYGESQPIADNRTRAGRDLNRRIEFKILSD